MQVVKPASIMGDSGARGSLSSALTTPPGRVQGRQWPLPKWQPSFSWPILLPLLSLLAPLIADQTPFEDPGWKLHARAIDPRLPQQAGG